LNPPAVEAKSGGADKTELGLFYNLSKVSESSLALNISTASELCRLAIVQSTSVGAGDMPTLIV
jgi:hypothetical protein